MASGDSGQEVAAHYNAVPEKGIEERTKSRIFYLRNFNNWIKSILIGEFLKRIRDANGRSHKISVLDLCCGKGGDLLKWKKGNISRLICADIADVSLEQCKSRYIESSNRMQQEKRPQPLFTSDFIHADCSKVILKDKFSDPETKLDLCSCQFSLHYSFESESQAKCMLRNACESLKPGGYFIGTIPDSALLVSELRERENKELKNDVSSIEFEDPSMLDGLPPLFGAMYHFSLHEVVNCPEYLIHFPLLKYLLEELDMELVFKKSFPEVLDEFGEQKEGKQLLARMQALEPYPPDDDVELLGPKDQYYSAETRINQIKSRDPDRRFRQKLGTLSRSEWEVASLYLAFGFQKKT